MTPCELLVKAEKALEYSYSPYSHFSVGAALLTKEEKVYTGCNIENKSFSPTVCAERTAFFKAVSQGERNFEAIAIVGRYADGTVKPLCAPCGVCRQVMSEFCSSDFKIILGSPESPRVFTLGELLPQSFEL